MKTLVHIKIHIFKSFVLSFEIFSKTSSHNQYISFQCLRQIETTAPFPQNIKCWPTGLCFSPIYLNLKSYFWGILGQELCLLLSYFFSCIFYDNLQTSLRQSHHHTTLLLTISNKNKVWFRLQESYGFFFLWLPYNSYAQRDALIERTDIKVNYCSSLAKPVRDVLGFKIQGLGFLLFCVYFCYCYQSSLW